MGYDFGLDSEGFVLTHCRSFQQHPKFSLIGGIDPDQKRRELFEDQYRCKSYVGIDDACRDLDPDIVAISNPTESHGQALEIVLDVFQPEYIICEKPLSFDLREANDMVDLCLARGCRLYVNYMRRSDPGVIEVKRRLIEGSISYPVKGIAWYSKGIFHNGSHLFNLLQYWLGDVQDFKILQVGRLWNEIDPEPDVVVKFAHGAVYFLAAREEKFSHYTIELIASNGRLRYEQGGDTIVWQVVVTDPTYEGYKILSPMEELIPTEMQRYQWHVVDQIARDIDGLKASVCRGSDALETLRWLDEIRSMI
jgi:predicted dehydrogenase